jgi:hypothetical protein
MGIMPQTIAVWCRQLGHAVHYDTYWGQADPASLLPEDLDVLFISCYTQSSSLAYAISSIFRRPRTLTVIGGPHARSFPTDCARFFDLVVKDCDRKLVEDILRDRHDMRGMVSGAAPLTQFPTIEERLPELSARPFIATALRRPVSRRCSQVSAAQYTCGFCVDWSSRYATPSEEQLEEDLAYLSSHYPMMLIAFHDPNFGLRFNRTMDTIARIPSHDEEQSPWGTMAYRRSIDWGISNSG